LGEENLKSEHILGTVGYYVCEITMGVFGPAAFAIPLLLFFFVIFWKNYNRRSFVALNAVFSFIAATVVSALAHIFIHMKEGSEAFTNSVKLLYGEGAQLGGGGVVGGFAAWMLVTLLHIAGAIFVLIAALIPMILFLCGTTPVDVVKKIVEKIKKASAEHKEKVAEELNED
jgi:hypothetical protein